VVVAGDALQRFAAIPDSDMNASRVVPAIALWRGFPLYAGPDGGPIIDFMYGPMAAIAFLPAAIATTPAGALLVAGLLNAVAFFGPMVWLHLRLGGVTLVGAAAAVCFALCVLRDLGLAFSALTIHADAPALGLAAIACGLIATAPPERATARVASALAAVLAVWTKQTIAPFVAALVVFVALRDGFRAAVRYAALLAGFGATVSVIVLWTFGVRALVFNMLTLPGRMPWYGEAQGGKWAGARLSLWLLARNGWPFVVGVAVLALVTRREARDRRQWLRAQPWMLFALVACVTAPAAVVGGAKIGGYLNTHSVTTYFLVAALTLGLAARARAGSMAATAVLGVALVLLGADRLRAPDGPGPPAALVAQLGAWSTSPQQRAYEVARAHPGELYLPWNPLATLLAEGRLDNSEIGAWNRDLAGEPIATEVWRRWLPPDVRLLAHRPPTGAFTWMPGPTQRLPEFREPATLPGLEGWIVLRRDGALATPPAGGLDTAPDARTASPHP
jgi:hypothetical protein